MAKKEISHSIIAQQNIDNGLIRELGRGEFAKGSWQQRAQDVGWKFYEPIDKETKSLLRHQGQAVTRTDDSGEERYVYEDDSIDPHSQVDKSHTINEKAFVTAIETAARQVGDRALQGAMDESAPNSVVQAA